MLWKGICDPGKEKFFKGKNRAKTHVSREVGDRIWDHPKKILLIITSFISCVCVFPLEPVEPKDTVQIQLISQI